MSDAYMVGESEGGGVAARAASFSEAMAAEKWEESTASRMLPAQIAGVNVLLLLFLLWLLSEKTLLIIVFIFSVFLAGDILRPPFYSKQNPPRRSHFCFNNFILFSYFSTKTLIYFFET